MTVEYSYAEAGSYSVMLTVVDNLGASDSLMQVATTVAPAISLGAATGKYRNSKWVDLEWSDAVGSIVDVYRDGSVLATTDNDGSFRDSTVRKKDKEQVRLTSLLRR